MKNLCDVATVGMSVCCGSNVSTREINSLISAWILLKRSQHNKCCLCIFPWWQSTVWFKQYKHHKKCITRANQIVRSLKRIRRRKYFSDWPYTHTLRQKCSIFIPTEANLINIPSLCSLEQMNFLSRNVGKIMPFFCVNSIYGAQRVASIFSDELTDAIRCLTYECHKYAGRKERARAWVKANEWIWIYCHRLLYTFYLCRTTISAISEAVPMQLIHKHTFLVFSLYSVWLQKSRRKKREWKSARKRAEHVFDAARIFFARHNKIHWLVVTNSKVMVNRGATATKVIRIRRHLAASTMQK